MVIIASSDDRVDTYDKNKTCFINKSTGETFIRSNFNDVDMIIDDSTGYVNITRVCTINDKKIDGFLSKTSNLRSLLIYAKYQNVFDIFDITPMNYTPLLVGGRNDETFLEGSTNSSVIYDEWLIKHKDLLISIYNDKRRSITLKPPELNEIYTHLPFIDLTKTNKGYDKESRGTYLHPLLVHPVAEYADTEYACKVARLMHMINTELKLRSMTMEQKLEEQSNYISYLKEVNRNSNAGKNHETPGCIYFDPIEDRPNHYKGWYDETEHQNDHEFIINNVFNPKDTFSELKYYIKRHYWDDIEMNDGIFIAKSIDILRDCIQEIQDFNVNYPSINVIIDNCKLANRGPCDDLMDDMFEIYCSMKSGIKLFKYELTEKLSLTKQDKGLDLLDINHKTMGQCKCYYKSSLSIYPLINFIKYCEAYPKWKHILYILSSTQISKEVGTSEKYEIVRINTEEFMKWYEENTVDIDSYACVRRFFACDENQYRAAEQWLKNELESKDFIYQDETIEYINDTFKLNITNDNTFGQCFSHLYKSHCFKTNQPKDNNGRKLLVSPTKVKPVLQQEDIKTKIKEVVSCGQYRFKELKMLMKENGIEIRKGYFQINNLMDLFITRPRRGGKRSERCPHQVTVDAKGMSVEIWELDPVTCPEKARLMREFIESLFKSGKTIEEVRLMVNEHFHRVDRSKGFVLLLDKMNIVHPS